MRLTPSRLARLVPVIALLGCDDAVNPATPGTEDLVDDVSDVDLAPDTAVADTGPEEVALPPERVLPAIQGLAVAVDANPDPRIVEVDLTASLVATEILPGVTVDLWAYNGTVPGPVIHAQVGDEVIVHFTNQLPEETTIHWHGLRISDQMDGNPRIQTPVQPGESFTYRFVAPDAGTFWYHPHVRSNEQVEHGLYGAFVVEELAPPTVDAQRVFTIDDILLDRSGFPDFMADNMEKMHGRTGNTLFTNGVADTSKIEAKQGQVERWRFINPANARTMELTLEGASWRIVGTDGGLLPTPYTTERLVHPVGQRYDLEVTYDTAGPVKLVSHVLTLNEQNQVEELEIPIVEVTVEPSEAPTTVVTWPTIAPLPTRTPTDSRTLELTAENGMHGIMWMINGVSHGEEPLWELPQGTTLKLEITNKLGPEHPFHLHGQFFRILRREGRNVTASEPGLKDTILIPGLQRVELEVYLDNPGEWMAHCHILEHSELGMMGEFLVTPAPL